MKSSKELHEQSSLNEKKTMQTSCRVALPMTIITAENPNCQELSNQENNFLNDKLEQYLRAGGYLYKKIKGFCRAEEDGKLPEHAFIIVGMKLNMAKKLAKNYEQRSFIYVDRTQNDAKPYKCYAIDKNTGEYVNIDTKEHKGSITFTKFKVEDVDEAIDSVNECLSRLTDKEYDMYVEGLNLYNSNMCERYYYQKRVQATARLLQDD